MPRIKKQLKGINKTVKEKKGDKKKHFITTVQHIFGCYLSGILFTTAELLMLINGIHVPSPEIIRKSLGFVNSRLLNLAQLSADIAFDAMKPNATVSIDGSWTNRRNSKTFILDLIDISTKKIIAFQLMDSGEYSRKGNTNVSASLLEAEAFKLLLPKLMKCQKIKKLIKDGDTKLESIIKASGWDVEIKLDPNHLLKNWPKTFQKYNKIANGTLRGLKDRIFKYLKICLYSNLTETEKVKLFMNAYFHFLGNHTNCPKHGEAYEWPYRDVQASRQILFKLLNETKKILLISKPGETTNYNENFHSVKAKFVSKAFNLGNSIFGRYACSILQYNDPYNWIYKALDFLGIKNNLTKGALVQLTKFISSKIKKMAKQKLIKSDPEKKKEKSKKQAQIVKKEIKAKKSELAHK